MATTGERVGKNEALFREVNERIREASAGFFASEREQGVEFVCECSDAACYKPVELTLGEYETVRSDPAHFLVAPGHLWHTDAERRVAGNDRHWVVEKLLAAGRAAEAADPRT
ncbi:MAG: hypothetical protein ACRDNE_10810 [Gaiellaceae bacterium]